MWGESNPNLINILMNRILYVFALSLALSGCGLIPSKFDNVEFGYLSELRAISTIEESCNSEHFKQMKFLSSVLVVYSENTLNENIANIYKELDSLTTELSNRENPSEVYCKIKRENIAVASDNALEIFGKRRK